MSLGTMRFWPSSAEHAAQQAVEAAEKALKAAVDKLEAALKETLLECRKCKWRFEVKTATYIQTHWYVEPYSCTGGAYWNQGEGQVECPSCGNINRVYNAPEIVALKLHFKNIKDTH